ncbi:MAG: hypothetical protein KC476_03785 [Cyanobacteria bacterium HKST-UBA06]|nr:hypothetical protein [Cyanobacteria bacterium HKST-UBA05]MCA9798221.1 hypothetical protein [Cyanobacteria bacterium HKST-UBA04]MCA9807054.1 hypothetical protein [Cyanobacteria bacterium HKST-UBA06]
MGYIARLFFSACMVAIMAAGFGTSTTVLAEEMPPPGAEVIECSDYDDDGMCEDIDMETGEQEEETELEG